MKTINLIKSVWFLFPSLLLLSNPAFSQTLDSIQVYQKYELTFSSGKTYENFITDVRVRVTFSGPDNVIITQDAFWDGGIDFKVRFAPPNSGLWTYNVSASDPENDSLSDISGSFFVENYTGNQLVKQHGWLRVSDNGRYLSYKDGTPFFYLGDTAWEMSWKSNREELQNYVTDRADKGFTAIQFVPQSHQRLFSYGVENFDGEDYFLDENYRKLNPRYFDYVDEIVDSINAKGMVAVIVPLWAGMNEMHWDERWRDTYLTNEESILIPRYIGARYAADNVIWIVGGDNTYGTNQQQIFWNEFARILKDASGGRQLATVHPSGWNASFNYFDNDTPWLDFHMYQSSHIARADYTIQAATQGYAMEPVKPVLNGEAVYEDIYNRLWAPGDTTKAETSRIRDLHVRQAGYESILSGAIVGYTYGANGIWQWHKEGYWGSHSPRFYVSEAMQFPGSSNMTVLKSVMKEYKWYNFEPKPEYISSKISRNKITTATNTDYLVSYYASGTENVEYQLPLGIEVTSAKFINPQDGTEIEAHQSISGRNFHVQPPDTMDWVFVADIEEIEVETPSSITLYQNHPNPFNPTTSISYYLQEQADVKLTVYDAIGRQVQVLVNSNKTEGFQAVSFDASSYSSGVYFYVLQSEGRIQTKKMLLIK